MSRLTNCVNCGAVLHGRKCEYCGTEYGRSGFVCNLGVNECTGTIRFDGKEYQVYLGNVEGHLLCGGNSGRDMTGKLHIENPRIKRTFTLIEI